MIVGVFVERFASELYQKWAVNRLLRILMSVGLPLASLPILSLRYSQIAICKPDMY